ncbi:MAG: alkaline phosphatase family protein [Salibacteraceae bacterium]|jgi:predicted AlkP superfamily phosphohydrolase/phosphomutase/tetratricopeptide (TPR) repeat protein|nr:alkaline phosphatase family protein [Salibacteraceae bacterium]MDP4687640.1 alkaline phosphatase family protein [Salibacteraceae bacterium]MDP4762961.1 alkaline phosphatase family protein [Salibacteraceae bacterium]MDP4844446.1 alkaline phosphatase family protein [Salibacteraceae bacterium]MDP4965523.1 alkaline phosphatase family protein [Salibacteraceae bacterium]
MKAKRVLLIGWDAADWKIIDQLIAQGQMPTLQKMVENGVRGNLSTLDPVLSPMLWSSIATGKYADKHGIHGFTEPDYETGVVRPISSTSRKARAIWNILTQQDKKCNVFSWWPSNPAEPINGVMVSNLYQRANAPINKPWPMVPGTVHPKELTDHFASCRVHPDELTAEHILPFIPKAGEIDQEKDKRIAAFSKMLADAATVHSASTWALENTDWDFTAIYHDAIDHACHGFMKFRAPQLPGVPDDLFDFYKKAVDGMYQFHDMMLERTLNLVGPDTNVILISDHGFQSDHMRPLSLPKEPAGPAAEHRKHGVICCFGPDFKKGETVYGSSILDVCPTLLTLFGLPVGKDMDGSPLVQVFENTPVVKQIDSWEKVSGSFGEHDKNLKISKEEALDAVKQLVELGYIDDPGEDMQKAMQNTDIELKYNLSKVYASTGRPEQALALLKEINALKETYRFQIRIVDNLKRLERFDEAMEMLELIREQDKEGEKASSIDLIKAEILKAKKEYQAALRILVELLDRTKKSVAVIKSLADCYAQMADWKEAEKAYRACLELDHHDATLHRGIALCMMNQKKYEGAIEHALTATELVYQFPTAHFVLGKSLYHFGEIEMAIRSLEVATSMRPSYTAPRILLENIYAEHKIDRTTIFGDVNVEELDASSLDSKLIEQSKKASNAKSYKGRKLGEITVVSGLPRSGTSLMMQMLDAAGLDIYTDLVREADENNPKGFYEHEKVKGLAKNNKWLQDANGKVVKIVSPLLRFLPPNFNYKVIIMKRDVREVTLSQHKMLVKAGKAEADKYPMKIEETLKKQYLNSIEWMKKQNYIEFIEIDFQEAVNNAEATANQVSAFLNQDFDANKMAQMADENLYRNRLKK